LFSKKVEIAKIKQKGQSILEVVIAMGILSVILGGIIILLINITGFGVSSEARSLAVNYAQGAMDAVRTVKDNECCSFFKNPNGYYKVENNSGGWSLISSSQWVPVLSGNQQLATQMRRSIYIEKIPGIPDIPEEDGRKITITINWQTKGSPDEEYKIVTEMYKWKY